MTVEQVIAANPLADLVPKFVTTGPPPDAAGTARALTLFYNALKSRAVRRAARAAQDEHRLSRPRVLIYRPIDETGESHAELEAAGCDVIVAPAARSARESRSSRGAQTRCSARRFAA